MKNIELLLIRLKFFHARLQQECRCLALWSTIGNIGCIGIGGCIAFGLSALATILLGHSRLGITFLAGGIGLALETGILIELFLAEGCDEKVKQYRQQLIKIKRDMLAKEEVIYAKNLNPLQPERIGEPENWNEGLSVIQSGLDGIGQFIVILLAGIGYITYAAFFVLLVAGVASAPRDQQVEFMQNAQDMRKSRSATNSNQEFGPEEAAVVGGIVLFLVLVGGLLIAFSNH